MKMIDSPTYEPETPVSYPNPDDGGIPIGPDVYRGPWVADPQDPNILNASPWTTEWDPPIIEWAPGYGPNGIEPDTPVSTPGDYKPGGITLPYFPSTPIDTTPQNFPDFPIPVDNPNFTPSDPTPIAEILPIQGVTTTTVEGSPIGTNPDTVPPVETSNPLGQINTLMDMYNRLFDAPHAEPFTMAPQPGVTVIPASNGGGGGGGSSNMVLYLAILGILVTLGAHWYFAKKR